MYQSFQAMAQERVVDYLVEVIAIRTAPDAVPLMTICAQEGPIYITREQAMEFFGLVPASI